MKHDNIHATPDVSHIHNEGVAHEASDVNVGAIAKFTVGLLAFTLLTLLLMWMFKGFLEKQAEARPDDQLPPMALTEAEQRKSDIGPRLQGAPGDSVTTADGTRISLELGPPAGEYHLVRKQWEQILHQGTTNPETHQPAIIPIDEAMKKLLESGTLKSSPDVKPNAYDLASEMPSASSAGRMNEKRYQ
jgi:hypothetical protein